MDFVLIPSSLLHDKKFRALKTTDRRACLDAYVHIVEFYVFCHPDFQLHEDRYRSQCGLMGMGWKIKDSRTGIAKEIGVDPRSFRERIWPNLMAVSLVAEVSQSEAIIQVWL